LWLLVGIGLFRLLPLLLLLLVRLLLMLLVW